MGIFNAAIEIDKSDSVSKVKFNVDLSSYATKNNSKPSKEKWKNIFTETRSPITK